MNREQELIGKIASELGKGNYDNPAIEQWLKEYAKEKAFDIATGYMEYIVAKIMPGYFHGNDKNAEEVNKLRRELYEKFLTEHAQPIENKLIP